MAIKNKSTDNKCWLRLWRKGNPSALLECRLVQPLWKTVWNFPTKLNIELPFDPVIPLLGLYPKNPETPIQKNLCTSIFIAALFTISKCWKQPKCSSVNEWIKICSTFTQWSTMQQKGRRSSYKLCDSMKLESIMLSEIS